MNHAVFRRTAWLRATLCAAALLATEAMASECQSVLDQISRPTVSLRVDNDLFGGRSQDQGYTNGLLVTLVSPNLLDYLDDPFLPTAARWINRGLTWLQVDDFDQINMIASFGQGLFTPEGHGPSELTPDDRPYAAVLLFSVGYNARKGDHLTTNQLRLGMVGPSARGNEVQSSVHKVIGSPHFNGWDHQLRDEPVFQLLHERMRRHDLPPVPFARGSGLSQDMITHWGGALGNFGTHANFGAEWRIGWRLPDDFGSSPLRPAGENTAPPVSGNTYRGWAGHFFVAADVRWVLYDLTLDGNTWKNSHSVDKRSSVADVGQGIAVTRGDWKFAFAHHLRTREFREQKELPVYGSFTINRRF